MFQERREKLRAEKAQSARLMYTSALQLWRYAVTARVVLLATSATTLGIFMGNLRIGATVSQVMGPTSPMGPMVIFSQEKVGVGLATFLGVLLVLVVLMVFEADSALSRVMRKCAESGAVQEQLLGVAGILSFILEHQSTIRAPFFIGQMLFFAVACFWGIASS